MLPAASRDPALVIVEQDAACPEWMPHWGREPRHGIATLEREEWEAAHDFDMRLEVALARQALLGEPGATILLVTGARTDALSVAARLRLASSLAAHLTAMGGGALVLTTGYGSTASREQDLAELADDLALELDGADVRVSVRLPDTELASHARHAVPAAPPPVAGLAATA